MEFGQILLAQSTSIISLLIVILSVDAPLITRFCKFIYNNSYLTVTDDKGLFLFVFLTYLIVLISILEILRNTSNKKDKVVYIQSCNYNNSFILFVNFLSLYIYKKLCPRTLNLLIFGIINSALYNFVYLMNMKLLSSLLYCNFVLSNILNLLTTYVSGFDQVLNTLVQYYKGYKLFN